MTSLLSLAERCEAATGPDRTLDALVECELRRWQAYAVGLNDESRAHWKPVGLKGEVIDDQGFTRYHSPTYSFSLDAALTLVPEGAGLHLTRYWIAKVEGPVWSATISTGGVPGNPAQAFEAWDTPSSALALCAAALKARAETDREARK